MHFGNLPASGNRPLHSRGRCGTEFCTKQPTRVSWNAALPQRFGHTIRSKWPCDSKSFGCNTIPLFFKSASLFTRRGALLFLHISSYANPLLAQIFFLRGHRTGVIPITIGQEVTCNHEIGASFSAPFTTGEEPNGAHRPSRTKNR
jgi:hypothetical protein